VSTYVETRRGTIAYAAVIVRARDDTRSEMCARFARKRQQRLLSRVSLDGCSDSTSSTMRARVARFTLVHRNFQLSILRNVPIIEPSNSDVFVDAGETSSVYTAQLCRPVRDNWRAEPVHHTRVHLHERNARRAYSRDSRAHESHAIAIDRSAKWRMRTRA